MFFKETFVQHTTQLLNNILFSDRIHPNIIISNHSATECKVWKTLPSPDLFLNLDLLGIMGKTKYHKQVWVCLEVHAVPTAALAWPASHAMERSCSVLKVSDFQDSYILKRFIPDEGVLSSFNSFVSILLKE